MTPTCRIVRLEELEAVLRRAWCAETTIAWSEARPAAGQCAVTALVVQDEFGGELVRGVVNGQSHYWNLINGCEVDLTREQFADFTLHGPAEPRERNYLLASADTKARYELLRARVSDALSRSVGVAHA